MFEPKFTITNELLANIKQISTLVHNLNERRFPEPVLVELQRNAEVVSSYASTSIEGNPLPLTDVKQILKNKPENVRDSEQEVLNYNEILKEINKRMKSGKIPLSLDFILYVQQKININLRNIKQ